MSVNQKSAHHLISLNFLLTLCLIVLTSLTSMAIAKPAEPGDINATLNYTIDALKAKKYRKIYHHLLLPHFKQQIAKNGGIEKWLKEFAEIQGPKLLEMLVYIRKRNPYINNNINSGIRRRPSWSGRSR